MHFSIKFTVYEIWCFFEFFEIIFLNRNKTILVNDTLNLITHSFNEIQISIFFIRDTFFYLTHRLQTLRDMESFLRIWLPKNTRSHIFNFYYKIGVNGYVFSVNESN